MVYHSNSIILYGGLTNKGLEDENFYRYSIETRQWSKIETTGIKPGCRVFHSMNFFKENSLIIFGGNIKEPSGDYKVNNDLIYVDLKNFDCTTPFISNVSPSARVGHASSYNSNFVDHQHVIIGGLDQFYCPMDVYIIKEVEVTTDKKWVYEKQKMHSHQNVENKDEIFEIAKKTIISYKRKLENLTSQNIEINKK